MRTLFSNVYTHTHTCKYNVKKLAGPLFFFALFSPFLLLSQPVVNGPGNCGTPDQTNSELDAFYQQINMGTATAGGIIIEYDIPIHLYLINDDNGNPHPDYPTDYIIYNMIENVETANTFYTNVLSFYICEISFINSTNLQEISDISDLDDLYNLEHDENAVNIYMVAKGPKSGYSKLPHETPSNALMLTGVSNGKTLAHELGHYFGLVHSDIFSIRHLPDNSCNPDPVWNVNCTCNPCTGTNSGDRIADTPVDPGLGDFMGAGNVYEFCDGLPVPCIPTKNGAPIASYYPDYQNMMASYSAYREHFSPDQLEVIYATLTTHADRTFLVDNNPPACDNIEQPNLSLIATHGFVNRVAHSEDFQSLVFSPLEGANILMQKVLTPVVNCADATDVAGLYEVEGCTPQFLEDLNYKVGSPGQEQLGEPAVFNPNNGLSVADLIIIRQHILYIMSLPSPYGLIAADVNNDEKISTLDIILIMRVILQTDLIFSAVPPWRFLPEYALGSQFDFEPLLNDNPFTAVWQAPDGPRPYKSTLVPPAKSYLDQLNLNLLNPDLTIPLNWSFRAIKSGDVNFSAVTQEDQLPGFIGNGYAFSATSHACLQPGQTATVLVKAQTTEDIDAYQLGLVFDKDAIEVMGVNQGDITPFSLDQFGFNQLADGEIRTLWIDEKGDPIKFENNLKTLFKINIKAIEAVCDIGSVIEIEDNVLAGIFLDTEEAVVPMTLKLELIPGIIRHKLEQVYPNPAETSISFQVELGEAATVSAQVFDQFGNYLTTSGSYGTGEHAIVFNNTSSLQQGTLSYVITAGSETFTGNIIKLQ
ncbi:MAG: hypothetical protein HUU01_10090 [Saprospiraceae bacterium]|nr:hypothetical protein [Saprospiraceae bacterium]